MTERKVAVITGAAGGLGQALVSEFASQGWRVVASSRRPSSQPETESIWPVTMDVTDRAQVETTLQTVLNRWRGIHLLINNAGIAEDQLSWMITEDAWDRVLDVNLRGAFLCCQTVLPPMLRQRDGHIINISSFSARRGPRGQASYAAAKAGLTGLTQSLAQEVGSGNIRVNAVMPGVLPTPMTARLSDQVMADFARANALGRLNSVAEVARFIAFLGQTENISGQCFQLDSRPCRWT